MKKTFLLLCCVLIAQLLSAQNWQVTGVVISDEDSSPLIGVTVAITELKGQGTLTDINGKFSINVPAGKSLTFSSIGYKSLVKTITGSTTLNIVMESDVKMLNEVVAIGYGTMRKSDLTGAVASIKADQLQKTPSSGLDQALQGKAAGVTVNASSGQPGASAEVRIRGIGTINNSAPIYVVDGIILTDISFLSPNDIESTEILKDASATAIYGSRGANGVVLITTKQGKGKSSISFDAYYGVQNAWKKLDLMKRDEFAKTIIKLNNVKSEMNYFDKNGFNKWLAAYRLGSSPYYPNNLDYSQIETDWQSEVFNKDASIQNYHLAINGNSDKGTYSMSGTYFNQDGTIIGSNFKRLTLRLNSTYQARKWLKVGENLSFSTSTGRNAMSNNASPGASILSAALAMAPWDPVRYPDGSVNKAGEDLGGQISASSNFRNVSNPYSLVEMIEPKSVTDRWVGNLYTEITPMKDLVLRSSVSIDMANQRNKSFKYAYRYSDFDKSDKNFLSSSMSRYNTLIFDNILTYSKKIGNHSLTAMVGQTTEERNYYSISGSGASILNENETNWYLSKTTEDKTYANDGGVSRSRMFSLLGRVHYTYGSRYMATLNYRSDATSKFPENLRGNFPSIALAWRATEEEWLKGKIKNLDYLKIRAGWGRIGNEQVDQKSFMLTMFNEGPSFVDYVLGNNQQLASGATILTYANTNGKWETTEQSNVGLDLSLFNGLLSGNVDFYIRDTKDMILPIKAPAYVGNRYDAVSNVGIVRNSGLELTLEHNNKIGKLNYNINGNVSFVKNELTDLNGGSILYYNDGKSIINEGYALYTLWGYKYQGIYATNDQANQHLYAYKEDENPFHAGDAIFEDLDKNGKIDDNDKTDLGNPFPWLTYGLNIGANYGNVDMQIFFQGIYGNELYNAVREKTEGMGIEATLGTQMHNVWTPTNLKGIIPNPYGSSLNYATSSRFVEDGSYLRLKNIQIGYTLPKSLTSKATINRCRIYVSASNLLTFTKYTGYDPEIGSGIDYGNYPQSRTILFGLSADF